MWGALPSGRTFPKHEGQASAGSPSPTARSSGSFLRCDPTYLVVALRRGSGELPKCETDVAYSTRHHPARSEHEAVLKLNDSSPKALAGAAELRGGSRRRGGSQGPSPGFSWPFRAKRPIPGRLPLKQTDAFIIGSSSRRREIHW